MPLRKPTAEEQQFIAFMIRESKAKIDARWAETLMVTPMDEGGMGSLQLYPEGRIVKDREFGRTAFEYEFKDTDRVPVVASLNLDQHDQLFELDIWKVTFDPLIHLPEL